MLDVDRFSQVPIYEQVVAQVERLVMLGAYAAGSPLPSVRALSAELSVNPNTLQKAYAELERRGVCKSAPGTGRFVAEDASEKLKRNEGERVTAELSVLAERLRSAGVPMEKAVRVLEDAYGRGTDK